MIGGSLQRTGVRSNESHCGHMSSGSLSVRGAVTESQGAPFVVEELELEAPRADEVLVRLVATGICHTDLIIRDQWYPVPLPAVLGHEGAGVVEAVGAAVTKVAPGDHVAMSYGSCGACASCHTGRPWVCHDFWGRNFGATRADGSTALTREGSPVHSHFFSQSSFATHAIATERNVTRLDAYFVCDEFAVVVHRLRELISNSRSHTKFAFLSSADDIFNDVLESAERAWENMEQEMSGRPP